jgi:hypothetical protein
VLRLLRLACLKRHGSIQPKQDERVIFSAWMVAISAGILILVAGALASDAFLLPGIARIATDDRVAIAATIEASRTDPERLAAAKAAGLLALSSSGRVLLAAPSHVAPADYRAIMTGSLSLWFPVEDEVRARGMATTLAALASLIAVFMYRITATGFLAKPPGSAAAWYWFPGRRGKPNGLSREYRDAPIGDEELAGILGKHSR